MAPQLEEDRHQPNLRCLLVAVETAYEVKVGLQALGSRIRDEIQKDVQLMQRGVKVEWHFFPNLSSTIAISTSLWRALHRAGIEVHVHLWTDCGCPKGGRVWRPDPHT